MSKHIETPEAMARAWCDANIHSEDVPRAILFAAAVRARDKQIATALKSEADEAWDWNQEGQPTWLDEFVARLKGTT